MAEVRRTVFREVHADLPREGPGQQACTKKAVDACHPLPANPRILDIGCGPGMQTLHLAECLPSANILGVDAYEPFLQAARVRLDEAGMGARVRFQQADMRALPLADATFDLLWCEGAAYIMGVAAALQSWRRLLTPSGRIAFTELVWLDDDPPRELDRWWQAEYPDMGSIDDCLGKVSAAGYRVLDRFVLPESAWWDDYYDPMEARLSSLRRDHADVPEAMTVLDGCQREIDYYRRWSAHYGYLFVVAAVTDGEP